MTTKHPLPLWAYYLYVVISVPMAALSIIHGPAWVVPVLQAALFYPVFFILLRAGHLSRLFALSCLWAALTSCVVIAATIGEPSIAERNIFNGSHYRDEMFTWIATGIGSEGDITLFLPQHLKHLLLFCAACLISLGFLGLCFGCALLNYMSFYVGSLYLKNHQLAALLLGWPPWAIVRVGGFIAAAIFLVGMEQRWLKRPGQTQVPVTVWGWVAACLILADISLKYLTAETWRHLLMRLTWH